MKKTLAFLLLTSTLVLSCSDDINPYLERVIGKWQYIKSNGSIGREFKWSDGHRDILKFTRNGKAIAYDSNGVYRAESNIKIKRAEMISYGTNLNGDKWDIVSPYYFKEDTLVIRADGGFEFTDDYFVRMN